ncbi:unnamed protein product [Phytophthora fragariaefolia]|uniref:Unnamed protein product n=1 Tax=Phytophthora fragariaefolia TaxID=1490495 RepID=A0A9W6YMJ4_9STRA|nr:unnamed protein product [Phytophthora fragariaefolia]
MTMVSLEGNPCPAVQGVSFAKDIDQPREYSSCRLKEEFEDRDSNASDGDECQDWFVNDSPMNAPVVPLNEESSPKRDGARGATPSAAPATARMTRSVSSPAPPATKMPSDTKTITDEVRVLLSLRSRCTS